MSLLWKSTSDLASSQRQVRCLFLLFYGRLGLSTLFSFLLQAVPPFGMPPPFRKCYLSTMLGKLANPTHPPHLPHGTEPSAMVTFWPPGIHLWVPPAPMAIHGVKPSAELTAGDPWVGPNPLQSSGNISNFTFTPEIALLYDGGMGRSSHFLCPSSRPTHSCISKCSLSCQGGKEMLPAHPVRLHTGLEISLFSFHLVLGSHL
jgi:hypothetical protein